MSLSEAEVKEIAAALAAALEALEGAEARGAEGQQTVELDQQAIGRLSRMDALQHQAMARASAGRRAVERRRIAAALARIEEGEYGWCAECGEEIAAGRLRIDPAAPTCVSCAAG